MQAEWIVSRQQKTYSEEIILIDATDWRAIHARTNPIPTTIDLHFGKLTIDSHSKCFDRCVRTRCFLLERCVLDL